MRTMACLSALLLASGPGWAADLTKMDRTVHHEPVYQSKAPRYCLLVFGAEAHTKVWLVVDGNSLYLDENGKGDLRKAKRVKLSDFGSWFKAGDIQVADDRTKYISGGDWFYADKEHWLRIDLEASDGWKYSAIPQLADRALVAPVVHIAGPLTMSLGRQAPKSLKPGATVELEPLLGTPGLGDGAFAAVRTIPKVGERTPQADIEFPSKRTADGPLKTTIKFKWCDCCGGLNPSRLQVPTEAGQGKARITLSFPDWDSGKVAPAEFELPLVDASEAPRTRPQVSAGDAQRATQVPEASPPPDDKQKSGK